MLKVFLLALVKVFSEVLRFLCNLSVHVQISKMLTYKAEQIPCSVFTVRKFHTKTAGSVLEKPGFLPVRYVDIDLAL